jgi:hypothetical protein
MDATRLIDPDPDGVARLLEALVDDLAGAELPAALRRLPCRTLRELRCGLRALAAEPGADA